MAKDAFAAGDTAEAIIRKALKAPVIFDGRNLYEPAALKERGFERRQFVSELRALLGILRGRADQGEHVAGLVVEDHHGGVADPTVLLEAQRRRRIGPGQQQPGQAQHDQGSHVLHRIGLPGFA